MSWYQRLIKWVVVLAMRLSGVALAAVLVLLALILISYDPNDPSFNTISSASTKNWLGTPGANIADALRQSIGHGVWLLMVPLAALAWRRSYGQQIGYPNWRLLAAMLAVISGTLALALFGRSVSPQVTFHGGASGQLLATVFEAMLASPGLSVSRGGELVVTAFLGLVALALSLASAGWFKVSLSTFLLIFAQIFRSLTHWRTLLTHWRTGLTFIRSWFAHMYARQTKIRQWFAGWQTAHAGKIDDINTPLPRQGASAVTVEARSAVPKTGTRAAREAQPDLGFDARTQFALPPLNLLDEHRQKKRIAALGEDALQANARLLETVLQDFGVRGTIGRVRPGPVVTLYELEPAAGVRSSRVVGLADDIARSMSAVSCRVAPVPGANVIGIELPNAARELVSLNELLASTDFESGKSELTLALGKDIGGAPVMVDLTRMPHLLVAGTTGSGKSVGINTMILSILYRLSPAQCRLILVDPKMLELSVYDGIPHLLAPVVTEPKKAVVALKWVVQEMENRYRKMAKTGVRNIEGFNDRMRAAQRNGEVLTRRVQTGFDPDSGEAVFEDEVVETETLPFIIVVIDEMADLMMVAGKEIEVAVQRLAQMARAAGVHLITATQRPSVDVITGTIKANFPSRISFQVTSKIDSRTVLGEQGAEQLLGQGDMLYMGGGGRIQRVHGPFVSDGEVEKVVSFLKKQATPTYIEQITSEADETPDMAGGGADDSLYDQAVAIVTRDGRASTSYVQRRLQVGYNRAARLIERMEEQGVISPPNHAGKREILAGKQ